MANNMMGDRKGKADTLKKINSQAYQAVKDKWVFNKEANVAFEKSFARSVEIEKIADPERRIIENKKNGLEFAKALEKHASEFWSDCTGTIKPVVKKCLELTDYDPEKPSFSDCVDNSLKGVGLESLITRHNKFTESYKNAIRIMQSGPPAGDEE